MPSILVCCGTGEGQTAKVAGRIADELGARGHETRAVNVKEVDFAEFVERQRTEPGDRGGSAVEERSDEVVAEGKHA